MGKKYLKRAWPVMLAEPLCLEILRQDSASSGVRLFLDMVYSSSSRDEPDYKSALVALDLAHRWQLG